LGWAHLRLGHKNGAKRKFEGSLSLLSDLGDRGNAAITLDNLASLEESFGHAEAAQKYGSEAVRLIEKMRGTFSPGRETGGIFLESQVGIYHRNIWRLLKSGATIQAFEAVQQTKARALLDMMTGAHVRLDESLSDKERMQLLALRTKADGLNARMVDEGVQNELGSKARFAALKLQLNAAEGDLRGFYDGIFAAHAGIARRRPQATIDWNDLSKAVSPDTALLEYCVIRAANLGTTIDKVALFVVTRRKGKPVVSEVILPTNFDEVSALAVDFRKSCSNPKGDCIKSGRALYRKLIAPATPRLSGLRRLVICPDGPLWEIPFGALVTDAKASNAGSHVRGLARTTHSLGVRSSLSSTLSTFLMERYEIDYAYSASALKAARLARSRHARGRAKTSLLVLANPDFGDERRFGDDQSIAGQRPIDTPSRPIDSPSRPIDTPSRPIDMPSRAIDSKYRGTAEISGAIMVPRGTRIAKLPGTQREADALKRLYPGSRVLIGRQAQESIAKAEASKYRYLHFATHGFFNDAAPMLSSLVLAAPRTPTGNSGGVHDDGFLTAREIFDMELNAEMAVLSACNTARGGKRSGEGIIGLTWALFAAGCPTQIVSQWSVDDASTATLMEQFYSGIAKGRPKGASLRSAALSLLADGRKSKIENRKYEHPYYWAPFILMGDWR
jgi:CHAT domain-containing protein